MASSSTHSFKKSYRYDVLISFSGEDTRRTFVDHLFVALQQQGIQTFKDDERLKKGKKISDELVKSIEESKFFIIVFSKNYASSSWCLDELVKIMECHTTDEQIAYPVFYDVDPSEVRKQSGAVGEALSKHTKNMVHGKSLTIHNKKTIIGKALAKHTAKKFGKWREALKEAANLSGWDLRKTADGHEAQVIKLIVERISLELRSTNVNMDESLIGMEQRTKNLESCLEIGMKDVRMIGIKGMGGAGKTTLARAIFDRLSYQYEGKAFVENVREVSKASLSGLKSLQAQILSNVFNGQGSTITSVHDGQNMLKRMLCHKKVFIVLDDVDHKDQLEALAGEPSWFKAGSRIIITTRDEQLLIAHRVKWIHVVNLLSDEEAISLFNRHAFGREIQNQEYEMLSVKVVEYAAGLPLTIKVLGSFLCGKEMHVWMDALARLKTIPLKETLEKLELSYISLEDDYKEIFLDVACFMKGLPKDTATIILESCGFHAKTGLRILEQRSLIITTKFLDVELIDMHDHMQEMGKNIVRRSHPEDPNRHSRLWIQKEIEHVLANDLGTEATRFIDLELSPETVLKGLGKMSKLRCLLMNFNKYGLRSRIPMKIDEVSQYLTDTLRNLFWDDYPHWCLPMTFQTNNLVALHLRSSKIEQLWEGGERKVLKKLKSLDLCHSKIRRLDLSLTPSLEKLNISQCVDLVELQVHGGCIKTIVYLSLFNCKRLKSRSFIKHLESLEVLQISSVSPGEIHDIIPQHSNSRLLKLRFESKDMEELPSSIENLHKLVHLKLGGCRKLKRLPASICSLRHLKTLDLEVCRIKALPEDIGQLESLEELNLRHCKIREVPSSICNLKHLRKLLLYGCNRLQQLPENIGDLESLQVLNIKGTWIRRLPWSFIENKGLEIIGCNIPVEQILEDCILHPEGLYPAMFDSSF